MFDVGGDFWRPSGLQVETPRAVHPRLCQGGFWGSLGEDSKSLCAAWAKLHHPHSEVLPDVQREPRMFQFALSNT